MVDKNSKKSENNSKNSKSWWSNTSIYIKILIYVIGFVVLGGIIYFVVELISKLIKGTDSVLDPIIQVLGAITKTIKQCTTTSVVNTNITSGGSGYKSSPQVTLLYGGGKKGDEQPASTTATAVALLKGDKVSSIKLTDTGAGYSSVPKVVIGPPPSGDNATATAVIGGGAFSKWSCALVYLGFAFLALPLALAAKGLSKRSKAAESLEAEKPGSAEKLSEASDTQREEEEKTGEATTADKAEAALREKVDNPSDQQIKTTKDLAEYKESAAKAQAKKYNEMKNDDKFSQTEIENQIGEMKETAKKYRTDELNKIENNEDRAAVDDASNDGGDFEIPEDALSTIRNVIRSSNPCAAVGGGNQNSGCCKEWTCKICDTKSCA